MLTSAEEIFRDRYGFRIFSNEEKNTQVYKFLDEELSNDRLRIKLIAVLRAINSNPLLYHHPEKFKRLEEDV